MAFWKKYYKSKYTGKEIDAAVASGSQVPEIDIEDAGKILAVDAEGKIVAKSDPVPEVDAEDNGKIMKVSDGKWAVGTDNQVTLNNDVTFTELPIKGVNIPGVGARRIGISVDNLQRWVSVAADRTTEVVYKPVIYDVIGERYIENRTLNFTMSIADAAAIILAGAGNIDVYKPNEISDANVWWDQILLFIEGIDDGLCLNAVSANKKHFEGYSYIQNVTGFNDGLYCMRCEVNTADDTYDTFSFYVNIVS